MLSLTGVRERADCKGFSVPDPFPTDESLILMPLFHRVLGFLLVYSPPLNSSFVLHISSQINLTILDYRNTSNPVMESRQEKYSYSDIVQLIVYYHTVEREGCHGNFRLWREVAGLPYLSHWQVYVRPSDCSQACSKASYFLSSK